MNTTDIGNTGEQIAAEELSRQGYEVLERNWKTRASEIDIIARKDGVLYFAEVKYRKSAAQGDGFDYITNQKLYHMQRAAGDFVRHIRWDGEICLLAISVLADTGEIDIREV